MNEWMQFYWFPAITLSSALHLHDFDKRVTDRQTGRGMDRRLDCDDASKNVPPHITSLYLK